MTARSANGLGFLACAGLLAYAYYAQFVLHLDPCPLCIMQRLGIFATGIVFAVAAAHDPAGWGRRVYAGLIVLAAASTLALAWRNLYIQSLPPGSIPTCGASLEFMMKVFPLTDVLTKILTGSGECAKVEKVLGLAIPAWVLIAAIVLGAYGLWVNLRRWPPVLRF